MLEHEFVPGISAQIIIDGRPATQHLAKAVEVKIDDSPIEKYQKHRTLTAYIESNTDQEFEIKLLVQAPYSMADVTKLGFHVWVDGGEKVWHTVCPRPEYNRAGQYWEATVNGMNIPSRFILSESIVLMICRC